jgi:hypothetical protein
MSFAISSPRLTLLALLASLAILPARAADAPTQLKDLTAVLALLGQPCDEVVSVVKKADNDNIASCKNGLRYRVFVNPEGRVVAQKQ